MAANGRLGVGVGVHQVSAASRGLAFVLDDDDPWERPDVACPEAGGKGAT